MAQPGVHWSYSGEGVRKNTASRRRLRRIKLVGPAAIVLVLLGVPIPALASWYNGAECPNRVSSSYGFDGVEWDLYPGLKEEAEDGYRAWFDVDDIYGGSALDPGGQGFTMRWEAMGGSGPMAHAECFPPSVRNIEFNSDRINDYLTGAWSMTGVSAHEWGHGYGLGHAGDKDTQAPTASDLPTMHTCRDGSTSFGKATLSQDDWSGVQRFTDVYTDASEVGWGSVTPNSSFERGTTYWQRQNAASFSTYSGGVDSTPRYATRTPTASPSAVFADDRITNGWGLTIKARVNYRRHDPASSGHVKVVLKWGHTNYADTGFCTTTFSNQNLNSELQDQGWTWQVSQICTVLGSWQYCDTPAVEIDGSYYIPPDAVDVRVAVYTQMYVGSDLVGVRIDRTRVMAQN